MKRSKTIVKVADYNNTTVDVLNEIAGVMFNKPADELNNIEIDDVITELTYWHKCK